MKRYLLAATVLAAIATPAIGAGILTNGLPVATSLTGSETIPADTNLPNGLNPQSEAVTVNLLTAARIATLTYAATITPNAGTANYYQLTLGGNVTSMATPTNLTVGQSLTFQIAQSVTGSNTVSWSAFYDWAGSSAPTQTATANRVDVYTCRVQSTVSALCTQSANYTVP